MKDAADAPDIHAVICRQDVVMEPEAKNEAAICSQDAVMAPADRSSNPSTDPHQVDDAPSVVAESGAENSAVCRQDAVIEHILENNAVVCRQDAVMNGELPERPPEPCGGAPPGDAEANPLPPVTWLGALLSHPEETGA
jgi:hypothetical protein